MNSLERLVGIIDLFEGEDALLSAEQMHERLGYTRSTLYRYLRILTNAGLLSSLHSVGYTLGPRISELDYRIRARDPLIHAAKPHLQRLAREHNGVGLLCRRFRDKVLCVHQEAATEAFTSHYERGRARSLFMGAASRVILAHLPSQQLRRLYEADPEAFAQAGIGETLPEVRAFLRKIRNRGYDLSFGQMTPGVTGIGAPLLDASGMILGSFNIVIGKPNMPEALTRVIGQSVVEAAQNVSRSISA